MQGTILPSVQTAGSRFLPDECVDFGDVNVVQLLDSVFDLVFVGLDIHNEYKRVVVLNLLHGGLCCQGVLYDGIVIQPAEKPDVNKSSKPFYRSDQFKYFITYAL